MVNLRWLQKDGCRELVLLANPGVLLRDGQLQLESDRGGARVGQSDPDTDWAERLAVVVRVRVVEALETNLRNGSGLRDGGHRKPEEKRP
jgi:hypothetical protein